MPDHCSLRLRQSAFALTSWPLLTFTGRRTDPSIPTADYRYLVSFLQIAQGLLSILVTHMYVDFFYSRASHHISLSRPFGVLFYSSLSLSLSLLLLTTYPKNVPQPNHHSQPHTNPPTDQTFVFLSRSSLSLGLPPIPLPYLPLPTLIQGLNLLILSLQASHFILSPSAYTPPATPPTTGADGTITRVFLLICLEGLCGGAAYVNTFYHVGRIGVEGAKEGGEEGEGEGEGGMDAKSKLEREFRIGATGAADSCGILFASLISMPLEKRLCGMQVEQGRSTCRDL